MDLSVFNAAVIGQASSPAAGGSSFLILIVGMFVLMYFMMIRPQQKRQKQHKAMLAALKKGDRVLTSGGIVGKVMSIDESTVLLEVSEGVNITVQRGSVSQMLVNKDKKGGEPAKSKKAAKKELKKESKAEVAKEDTSDK